MRVGTLSCPVCGQALGCRESLVDDETRLKARAREHLGRHDLSESKRGIYTVMMVDRMDERVLDSPADVALPHSGAPDGLDG